MEIRSYILPFLMALSVHALVFVLVGSQWEMQTTPRPQPPRHIAAEMVDLRAFAERRAEQERIAQEKVRQEDAARERERKAAEQRQQELEQKKARAEAEKQARADAERKRQEEQVRKREAEKKRQAEVAARKKAEAEARQRKAEEQARREAEKAKREAAELARKEAARRQQQEQAEAELQQALERERKARAQAEAAARKASQAVIGDIRGYIQAVLQDSWRIPSTARNGMKTVVTIHFLPNGEVDQAYIETSSGNAAFDNSAVQAVYRVQSFPRIAEIDPILFERNLRKLKVEFRPEGLRW